MKPLEKYQFLTVLIFCFLCLKRLFSFLEYRQTHFPLSKYKKMENFQIFDKKPWTIPFGKIPIFNFFNFLFFIV